MSSLGAAGTSLENLQKLSTKSPDYLQGFSRRKPYIEGISSRDMLRASDA
jgi:hypothetical protein